MITAVMTNTQKKYEKYLKRKVFKSQRPNYRCVMNEDDLEGLDFDRVIFLPRWWANHIDMYKSILLIYKKLDKDGLGNNISDRDLLEQTDVQ